MAAPFEADEGTRIEGQPCHSARIASAPVEETFASSPNRSSNRSRASRWRRRRVASARTADTFPPCRLARRLNHLRSFASTEMLSFCALAMTLKDLTTAVAMNQSGGKVELNGAPAVSGELSR